MTPITFEPQPDKRYAYQYPSDGSKRTFQITTSDGPISGISVDIRISDTLPWVRLQKVRPADNTRTLAFSVSVPEGVAVRLLSLAPVTQAAYIE